MKEVYVAHGKDGEVLYVGQGNLGRHRHCLNGTSHNRNLNKYFFSNGEDGSIRVEVLLRVKTSEEALLKESDLILELRPKFNHIKTTGRVVKPSQKPSCMYESLRCGFQVDFRVVMKEFCHQINNNSEQAHFILKYHPEIERYYEALGAKKIKGGETCYYELIWRPDEIYNCENGKVTVKDVLCHLPDLLQDLVYHQEKLEQYLPENGYGSFDWLYSFLCDYMKECLLHKDSFIYCCR